MKQFTLRKLIRWDNGRIYPVEEPVQFKVVVAPNAVTACSMLVSEASNFKRKPTNRSINPGEGCAEVENILNGHRSYIMFDCLDYEEVRSIFLR